MRFVGLLVFLSSLLLGNVVFCSERNLEMHLTPKTECDVRIARFVVDELDMASMTLLRVGETSRVYAYSLPSYVIAKSYLKRLGFRSLRE